MALSPQQVHDRLRMAARRYRRVRCARPVLSGAATALAILTVLLLADALFHFGSAIRWAAFVLVIAPLLAGGAGGVCAARRVPSEAGIARRIETAAEGSRNALISAVQFDRELPPDSPLREALFQEMRDPFPNVNWKQVFGFRHFQRIAAGLGAAFVTLGLFALVRPLALANSAARILLPGSAIAPLTRTQIAALTPGSVQVIHGHDLLLSVRIAGHIPKGVRVAVREPGGSWQKTWMEHEVGSGLFTLEWKGVREPFAYRVEAGDAASPLYQVTVRPRTVLVHRAVEITPPAYTRLGKESRRDFATLQSVVPGSRAAFTLEFNHPLAELECSGTTEVRKITGTTWNVTGTVQSSTALRLDYRDADGIADSETLPVSTAPDDPPRITITAPKEGAELFAALGDALALTFEATDNFGLGSVALYRTSDEAQEAERIQEWKEAAGQKRFAATFKVPLAKYARDGRVTLALVAKDQNDVAGPGVTWSRPVVVTIRSEKQIQEQEEDADKKTLGGMEALVKLQTTNLEQTRSAFEAARKSAPALLPPLLERQSQIADNARQLALSAERLAAEARSTLQALGAQEMPAAIRALRNATTTASQRQNAALAEAIPVESAILVRLQGALQAAKSEVEKGKLQDLISGVEELLRNQRELLRETQRAAAVGAKALSERQDALAEKAAGVRKTLEKASRDASVGDQDFRDRIAKAAQMFGEAAVYEQMLAASEQLQNRACPAAVPIQTGVVGSLAKIAALLNQWQIAAAARDAETLKQAAREMTQKLDRLAQMQRGIVEKSKEIARKADMRPEDTATAKDIQKSKEQMAQEVEQMLVDAHIFPDIKPANELRGELTQIYEDVIQADKEAAAAGTLKANEVAVQKEDGLLSAIEQAKKIAEDLEMWLPNANDTTKWLCENFDKTEMPDIPNLPLPDAFEDLVGNLLQEQEGLAEQAQDSASNQALAQAQQGWSVGDGPMPGFSAQGKSGNTRPNKNEQNGRSSGGREGMSSGEMVGESASNLEGSTIDARRTNDAMQQGRIKDDGGIHNAKATGGGKVGGFSDRNGMDGNAPLRQSNAPRMAAQDALAVQQALLAEKTAKTYGQASLLYLRAGGLPEVSRLMDQSQSALREGRMDDFRTLHQRIVTRLGEVKGAILPGNVLSITTTGAARPQEKQLLGGDEGQAPPAYKKAVVDYYRSLSQ